MIDVFSISYEIFLWLMQRILTDNKSTMVQVKTWCHQLKLVSVMAWCHQLTLVKVMAWNHQVTTFLIWTNVHQIITRLLSDAVWHYKGLMSWWSFWVTKKDFMTNELKHWKYLKSNWCNGYPFMSKDPCRPHTGNTQWSMWVCLLTWDCLSHYNFHYMAYKKSA